MWDTKCQFQFKARHITINAKNTKSDVNVSEMLNPVDFYGRFQPWRKNIQSPFLTLENVLLHKL